MTQSEQVIFEMGLALGRMTAKLDRIEKTLDGMHRVARTPEHIEYETRVARTGLCNCRQCEERRLDNARY